MSDVIRIGVVGYSSQKFDESKARSYLSEAFDKVESDYRGTISPTFIVISGPTDIGIPALAYREAIKRKWMTVGIACEKAKEYDCFDVNYSLIEGKNWGDESPFFLKAIDVMVKIGGGKQSQSEAKQAKDRGLKVIEYDLEAKT